MKGGHLVFQVQLALDCVPGGKYLKIKRLGIIGIRNRRFILNQVSFGKWFSMEECTFEPLIHLKQAKSVKHAFSLDLSLVYCLHLTLLTLQMGLH